MNRRVDELACAGFCQACGHEHSLPASPALEPAKRLMSTLRKRGHIGPDSSAAEPRLGLEYLYGPARGQMFGVLVYRDGDGKEGLLKAFSGQYNGLWLVPGWVAPILDPAAFGQTIARDEPRIKMLTRRIDALQTEDPLRHALIAERRELSRRLMEHIFGLYHLTNFRGQSRLLTEVFQGFGMPTGTGECCAPKLLHCAATHGLFPLGLAEFYLGRANRSATRTDGAFYPPCAEKCQPILGFMLCGVAG